MRATLLSLPAALEVLGFPARAVNLAARAAVPSIAPVIRK